MKVPVATYVPLLRWEEVTDASAAERGGREGTGPRLLEWGDDVREEGEQGIGREDAAEEGGGRGWWHQTCLQFMSHGLCLNHDGLPGRLSLVDDNFPGRVRLPEDRVNTLAHLFRLGIGCHGTTGHQQ